MNEAAHSVFEILKRNYIDYKKDKSQKRNAMNLVMGNCILFFIEGSSEDEWKRLLDSLSYWRKTVHED